LDAANAGDCSQETISVLTCYAYRGHGYEGAQTALGQCLIKTNSADEGITWLTRAADAGWPDAQKSLALHYLNGEKTAADLPEAGKWSLLYRKNPSLLSLGVSPEKKLTEEVRSRLSPDEKTEAIRRANRWNAKFWTPDHALDNRANAYCYAGPARRVINKKEVLEGLGMPSP
jgi:TPR repeat protein